MLGEIAELGGQGVLDPAGLSQAAVGVAVLFVPVHAGVEELLGEGIEVDDVAALLLAAMDGLQIQWLLNPERGMVKRFELLATLLEDYVSAR